MRILPNLMRCRRRGGLTHFVAAALPKSHICALRLGFRASLTSVLRGQLAGLMRARGSAPQSRQYFWRGDLTKCKRFSSILLDTKTP